MTNIADLLPPKERRKTRIGLVAGGLGAYWPQFPDLLPQLQESTAYVVERFESMDGDVTDVGFVSDAQEAAVAAEKLRVGRLRPHRHVPHDVPDVVDGAADRAAREHAGAGDRPAADRRRWTTPMFGTGEWLAYCGQCPVPEVGNVFRRAGIPFRSVSGWLRQESAWERIGRWVRAADVRAALRHARHGLMGHLYPGMLDVSTDLTLLPVTFGSHVEVLEFDDLRVRVEKVTDAEIAERMALARKVFTLDESVDEDDFAWGAQVSVGLDRLVDDFDLDSLAYYHRGLNGEQHERLGAGMILGASLLTARGIPMAGEYELRTIRRPAGHAGRRRRRLVLRDPGAQLRRRRGRDGTRRPGAPRRQRSRDPLLRGLGVYHGKRGWGVSVEFDVQHGPVTLLGVGQDRDGSLVVRRVGGHGGAGPAAGDRQHHLPGRLRPGSRRVGRRMERDRHRPPLVAVARSPSRRLPRPPRACSASTSARSRRAMLSRCARSQLHGRAASGRRTPRTAGGSRGAASRQRLQDPPRSHPA